MFKNNKKRLIIIITAAVLVVAAIATITIIVLSKTKSTSSTQPANQSVKVTKETADALKLDAIKILSSDPAKAKIILEKAKAQYLELKDANGASNIDSQLYIIEHELTNKPVIK